ncbi:MAG: ATP-dependent DNA helicase UvrD2 [Propioniciclava sp.]|uniref:ATP-dependent DNA helicase UvrD2 n=1 Tax=Propioniciclava sp. TaxID=2038686 RepID=UPI0039E524C7
MNADSQRILDGLDPEQRQVALALEGPVVVLAGAGTGKTRAMTHRIAYGVATGAFEPTAVLALTFTTRAAGELRERLRGLGVARVQARTFHSAALRQAQYFWPQAYGNELPPVADHRIGLVADALRRDRLTPDTTLLRDMAAEISWAKVSNVAPGEYAAIAPTRHREVNGVAPDQVGRVMAHYEAVKAARGVIDFDDILLCTAGMLADNPDVAAQVRRTYRHFVVDEYQDVSPLQQALLDLWRGDSDELCVVGDPAQTIHSFAGAQASFLTGFTGRHPHATRIELVRDYRSTLQVVTLANALMVGHGPSVGLRAQRPDGPAPIFASTASEADEAATVAAWLTAKHAAGVPWSEMAVLYRIHAQSPAFEAALGDAGVPFTTRGSEGFFERAEVRAAIRALAAAVKATPDESPDAALRAALAGLGFTTEPPSGQGGARERWESWSALAGLGDDFTRSHPEARVEDLLAELDARARAQHAPAGQGVTLSSLHAAKGLEWDAVAITGAHEGSLPFILATTPEEVAEERRLFYVGVTRAREHLHISWSTSRNGGGPRRGASRFLDGVATAAPAQPASRPARGRPRRGSAMSAVCRVCGRGLTNGSERKLGRHTTCEASYDEATWEALRAWRKAEADAASLPAFVICTDATLMAVAERMPGTLKELSEIAGFGATKLHRYGKGVLAVLDSRR